VTALAIVLTVLCGFVAAVWASRHLRINREHREGLALAPDSPGPPADAPPVSVIVAGKDEEANIEPCLRSMLAQDYPHFELIVCDDRSTDATGRIAEAVAAEDPRCRVLHIDHLPDGWCGKNHAMQRGIEAARHDWLCMIDADCRQRSDRTLSVAVQHAQDSGADLLSVLPALRTRTFWEHVIQPVCSGVMMIWFLPEKVNNPAKRNAYANGAFMLMRREAYEAVGTHAAVRDRVNEDMHLARRVKEAGGRLRVIRGEGLYQVRMYDRLGAILAGWARIFYGTFGTVGRLTAALLVLVVMGLVPWAAAAVGLAEALGGAQPAGLWWACGLAGLAAGLLQISVAYRFYALAGAKPALAWTYPLGTLMAIGIVLGALAKRLRGGRVTWRGTTYTRAK